VGEKLYMSEKYNFFNTPRKGKVSQREDLGGQ
jgi:hypothetical protein